MSSDQGAFIVKIMETLEKNGYPEKQVRLPLEKMYEAAHNRGLNFNKVLEFLESKGIYHRKTTEKVIFFAQEQVTATGKTEEQGTQETQEMPSDMMGMMAKAQQMIRDMDPEQIAQLQRLYADMDPEQKDALLKQAKNLGLF